MALILRCDVPGCGRETSARWLPSGRVVADSDGWWLMPGADLRVACCAEHALRVPTAAKPETEGDTSCI